eukprot:SAG31_NODE_6045_length_2193_cov_0.862942_3_plen_192_part_00
MLAINLATYGISPIAAGWLGCWMTLIGCVAGVLMGAVADRFGGQMKGTILLCYTIATVGFLGFGLVVFKLVPGSRALLYVLGVIGGTGLNAPIPLFCAPILLPHNCCCDWSMLVVARHRATKTCMRSCRRIGGRDFVSHDICWSCFGTPLTSNYCCPNCVLGSLLHSGVGLVVWSALHILSDAQATEFCAC